MRHDCQYKHFVEYFKYFRTAISCNYCITVYTSIFTYWKHVILSLIYTWHNLAAADLHDSSVTMENNISDQLQQPLDLPDSDNSTPRERCDPGIDSCFGNLFAVNTDKKPFDDKWCTNQGLECNLRLPWATLEQFWLYVLDSNGTGAEEPVKK